MEAKCASSTEWGVLIRDGSKRVRWVQYAPRILWEIMQSYRNPPSALQDGQNYRTHDNYTMPNMPEGLKSILDLLQRVYPNHTNPLQVSARQKRWLGGPDPLDFISIYPNPGDPAQRIPPHWHFVGMGLSDLYGDGRVYPLSDDPTGPSGCGVELTFRLERQLDEDDITDTSTMTSPTPPMWPAALMQQVARAACVNGATLNVGDVVTWHAPLDGDATDGVGLGGSGTASKSRVRHLLLASDAPLARACCGNVEEGARMATANGVVEFVQLVGVCQDEVRAAQRWSGREIARLLRADPLTGGAWLLTEPRRQVSVFDLDGRALRAVQGGAARDGSSLDGVNVGRCAWRPWTAAMKATSDTAAATKGSLSTAAITAAFGEATMTSLSNDPMTSLINGHFLNGVEVFLNVEAALMLPLMVNNRLQHGKYFSFTKPAGVSQIDRVTVTFVPPNCNGVLVGPSAPYAAQGWWLQIFVDKELQESMKAAFSDLDEIGVENRLTLPKEFSWPKIRLKIVIEPEFIQY